MNWHRREFLKRTGLAAGAAVQRPAGQTRGVSIVLYPAGRTAAAAPARWAANELRAALAARGVAATVRERLAQAPPEDLCVVAAGADAGIPAVPEALGLAPGKVAGRPVLHARGYDARGLVYALLELADRVQHAADPVSALDLRKPVVERPANAIRGVARLFCSDVEDKPWYNDRDMWPRYLTMLATQRFNRFHLALGIGYDFLRQVTDGYFLFAYPFLLSVPGYNVRVPELADAERDRNLEMLKFISQETAARGLEFQLGIWMHGYEWIDSPRPNCTIAGLTPETHGPYCRDAVRALLKACPAISGVTFRIHGESGVQEGSYEFWKTVFQGVASCGRKVEIDMHAKGMDQGMIDVALGSGMPVKISPKYWAEHMGMPYHQADIRELERPRPGREGSGLMRLSSGSRSFLRYGYGDLLREDRRYGVLHRIWPGTQRLLLWADPIAAAAHSRAFGFCSSDGVDIMEPLSFKGRRGSGIAGDRCGYADASLRTRWDWEKYVYSLRVWGRLLYNPEAEPDVWQRYLRKQFQTGAPSVEGALAHASRILPLITTAHGASAGNNSYWPEVYTNQPIVDPKRPHPHGDSPAPKVFGNVSPLDPQLFSRINDFADELLQGPRNGRYSPVEAAQWLEDLASAAAKHLAQAGSQAAGQDGAEYRRLAIDVALEIGLGRFFAAKIRGGVLYAIFERTGDRSALEEALKAYRGARSVWAGLANRAKSVYVSDLTVGERPHLRGHWLDRLPAIDADIADMAAKLEQAQSGQPLDGRVRLAIQEALGRPQRISAACRHVPATRFRPGAPLELTLSVEKAAGVAASLHYRRVTQAERWRLEPMQRRGDRFTATVPADYTQSPYPLQYYFELRAGDNAAWLYPGFGPNLAGQPYFTVSFAAARARSEERRPVSVSSMECASSPAAMSAISARPAD
ncbi:MAG: hypothetical protein HY822_08820 [Acidobacteria bacterium]|nr:hypothetical protein [Acidobacteriota bacterium]